LRGKLRPFANVAAANVVHLRIKHALVGRSRRPNRRCGN